MRKRQSLAVVLAACLAVTIGVAVFAQAQPIPATTTSTVVRGDGANVSIQLPQGNLSHPLNLRFGVTQAPINADYSLAIMQVFMWVPATNSYIGVAILSTNTNQSAITWVKTVVNGSPIWTPPLLMNYFVPTPDQLQITIDNDGRSHG